VDGILIIDKPEGYTSHDVVARLRRILKTKKIGHTGTLDPFATGVLVMLVGKATRLAQFIDKDEKEYEALVRFGFETDTGDRTGVRSAECGMRSDELTATISSVDWEGVFSQFRGEIEQTPPMFSAKKVDGKKLYEHARKGVEIERKPVKINIKSLELSDQNSLHTPHSALRIRIVCSAGTYIRTLAQDIGRAVGVGAHLEELRRTRAGIFALDQAVTIDQLDADEDPSKRLLPMSNAVAHLAEFVLDNVRVEKTRSGLSTGVGDASFSDGASVRMIDSNGEIVAIGFFDAAENSIRPKIVLV
jgi:tRNA pseudouridine55 synthase